MAIFVVNGTQKEWSILTLGLFYLQFLHHAETMGSDEVDSSIYFNANSTHSRLWWLEQQHHIVLVAPAELYMYSVILDTNYGRNSICSYAS